MEGSASGERGARIRLPGHERSALATLARRLAVAVSLVLFVALVAFLGRDGYEDSRGGDVGLLEAVYYATVSITTTGYGDIVPITDDARLATILLVTPARVVFLILLVGTTLELLAGRTREALRVRRWRSGLRDHIIVCGYGTKGKSAVDALVGKGTPRNEIVVIDERRGPLQEAAAAGLAAVAGSAASTTVLEEAGIDRARAVIVAPDRDDTAVLVTLTARELSPESTTVVSAVRETENVHLLKQSGADSVITSSAAAGRLMGLATETPRLVEVLEDLLSVGEGLDLAEREVGPESAGRRDRLAADELLVAVVRDGELMRFDDPRAVELRPGDRVLYLCSHETAAR